jgi:uncharacterized RDD family membrane protein YckC
MPVSKSKRRRYQPPPKPNPRPSPRWVPVLILVLLILGVLVILFNYLGTFWSTSNIWLWVGFGFIAGGLVVSTQYR